MDAEAEAARLQREQERAARHQAVVGSRKRATGAYRGDGAEEGKEEESKYSFLEAERALDQYVVVAKKNTEFFSEYEANDLLQQMSEFANAKGCKIEFSDTKYKAKMQLLSETGSTEIKMRILQTDEGKRCMEFTKLSGEALQFQHEYQEIKEFFADMI